MKTKEFEKKKKYSDGSGISAYVDDNISMKLNQFGLYEEIIHNSDENSFINPLVVKTTPYLNDDFDKNELTMELFGNDDLIEYDKRIGYFNNLYIGHVSEGKYRENGSSGGFGTWIFKELFQNNLIDGVIHVKEATDENTPLFKYSISSSIDEINEGAKTRYYPVELSQVLKVVYDTPGRYAVIGIPTFISSLRLLAKYDPIINERIIFTVGLVCGHQKSSKFAEFLAWQMGVQPGDKFKINFRQKLENRPANQYGVKIVSNNLESGSLVKPTSELFGQNWGFGFFKPLASDFTDDVFNETADITLGDAWLPEYSQDSLGNNIIIVRNQVINELLNKARKEHRIFVDEASAEKIFKSQSSHYNHTHNELAYRQHIVEQKNEWYPTSEVKTSDRIPFLRKQIQKNRALLSTNSHLLYEEAVKRNDINYFINEMQKYINKYEFIYKLIGINNIGFKNVLKNKLKNKLK